jgi:hypothetical protein
MCLISGIHARGSEHLQVLYNDKVCPYFDWVVVRLYTRIGSFSMCYNRYGMDMCTFKQFCYVACQLYTVFPAV